MHACVTSLPLPASAAQGLPFVPHRHHSGGEPARALVSESAGIEPWHCHVLAVRLGLMLLNFPKAYFPHLVNGNNIMPMPQGFFFFLMRIKWNNNCKALGSLTTGKHTINNDSNLWYHKIGQIKCHGLFACFSYSIRDRDPRQGPSLLLVCPRVLHNISLIKGVITAWGMTHSKAAVLDGRECVLITLCPLPVFNKVYFIWQLVNQYFSSKEIHE